MMGKRDFETKLYYNISLDRLIPRTTSFAASLPPSTSPSSAHCVGPTTATQVSHRWTQSSS